MTKHPRDIDSVGWRSAFASSSRTDSRATVGRFWWWGLVLALLVGSVGCASPAESPADTPEVAVAAALDSERLAELESAFQSHLDAAYEAAKETDENFPGATAAFVLSDGTVRGFATGMNDVDRELAMTPDLRMPSGSIGKTYVAATALALRAEGKLDLDSPISKYFGDEEWFARLPNGSEITVRNLANHTSGLIDHAFDSEEFVRQAKARMADPDGYFEPLELVQLVLDKEPLFAPGEGYSYTDTGYILLGLVIEQAAGASFYDEVRRFFLDPLALQLTLPADRRDIPEVAQGYAHTGSEFFGTTFEIVGDDGMMTIHPLTEWTGGGFVNNPQDLVRWAKALYEGRAIQGEYLEELLTPGFKESDDLSYGLGAFIASTPFGMAYGHSGFYPGYNSRVMYFADHGAAVALQINSDTTETGDHAVALAGGSRRGPQVGTGGRSGGGGHGSGSLSCSDLNV